ncbi:SprT family zinc-dependent metalloprotease [Chitinivorax sp. B]|uniref:M48 family metallopeptidase n=1 Tax=Chitinivorax sp. B TaxID=2502235 RepID=UPI002017F8C1|nr:SprT family zinc-dependent metalloprotease [Chitinivorax sp. B]
MPTPQAEQRSIKLADRHIDYILKRSAKRRTFGLRIDRNGLTVNAPARIAEAHIQALLFEKADWILDKLANWLDPVTPNLRNNATLWLLGEPLTLRMIQASKSAIKQIGNELLVGLPDESNLEITLKKWLMRQAKVYFAERLAELAGQLNVTPSKLLLSSARTRWGSCNSKGEIRLNWRLIQAPTHLIDYVVVHELAHLLEMNHSPRFWSHVTKLYPDYQQARAELKSLGPSLNLL